MPELFISDSIFRAYDIRGVVASTLSANVVREIGRAIGSEALARGEKTVLLGRDGRLSGQTLCEALSQGIVSTGCDVVVIGQVPTPVLYYATHELVHHSGVMITGSHNPPEYNGLKIVIAGETLAEKGIAALKTRIDEDRLMSAQIPGRYKHMDLNARYLNRITSDIHVQRPMKVVVDCGNGVAGELAPRLLRALGCEVVELFCDVDGHFPNHHPDPAKPENLSDLILAVEASGAEIGLAFDGDGDRLGVVTPKGQVIWPDRLLMLYAKDVLQRQPGAEIIYDIKSSRQVAKLVEALGGKATMSQTGHSRMKAKLKQSGSPLGGEMSGHIFFKERWYGFDDALYCAGRLLEILALDDRDADTLFASLPDSYNTPELTICMQEGEQTQFMDRFSQIEVIEGAEISRIDGIRADFSDGFGLVRASNTTPCLTLRFEGDTPDALERIKDIFRVLIVHTQPGLALPF